jgi:PAS domain-containing protein
MAEPEQQPLELILARNLMSNISLAAILVDTEGTIVFYNEAAGEFLGTRFEEMGRIPVERWSAELGPFDEQGRPLPREGLPLNVALRQGRPGYGSFYTSVEAGLLQVEATALPLIGSAGLHGAVVVFWPLDGEATR